MSTNLLTFVGTLRAKKGLELAGALIEVADSKTNETLLSTFTGDNGRYRIEIRYDRDPTMFRRIASSSLTIRAVSADLSTVAERAQKGCEPGTVCTIDLEVDGEAAKNFQRFGASLKRVSGRIINPEATKLIDAAIENLAPTGSERHRLLQRAARCPMPGIETFDRLLDDAWGVLDGHPGAIKHYRATLSLFGSGGPERRASLIKQGTDLLSQCGCGTASKPAIEALGDSMRSSMRRSSRAPSASGIDYMQRLEPDDRLCLVPRERMIPTWLAAFRVAQSNEEAAFFTGALSAGLCGLDRMQMIYIGAIESLATGDTRGLEGLLGYFGGECGPDDGPIRPGRPQPDCPEPPGGGLDLPDGCAPRPTDDCLMQIAAAATRSTSPPYVIDSISDVSACPGATITIIGTNFGNDPGLVTFPYGSFAPGGTKVAATSWTDTEIVVVVPFGAGSGELSLDILESTVFVCGFTIGITREGTGNRAFFGGRAAISSFTVNAGRPCVEPGEVVHMTWVASQGGWDTSVHLRVNDGVNAFLDLPGLPARGSSTFVVPAFAEQRRLTFTLEATNSCGNASVVRHLNVDVVPVFTIEGIEITQGIQTFWRPGVVPNSLPTVAGKDTIVRVYVSCFRKGFLNDRIGDVTATLGVDGTALMPINGITPIAPGGGNPFISVGPANQIDRQRTDHTLNFRIPAALSSGTKNLSVLVTGPMICGVTPSNLAFMAWTWTSEPALRVRFVRIRDDRSGGTGMQPTVEEARFTINRAFDLLPSPATDVGPARTATMSTSRDFTTLDGLTDLLDDVQDEHGCEAWEWLSLIFAAFCPPDDEAYWMGLTTPVNRGLAPRPGNTCVAAIHTVAGGQGEWQRVTPAHELAHNLDFKHVNRVCNGVIDGPFYAHPNNGDLLDVPFDPFWNQAINGSVQDLMSYGCQVWTSGDSWERMRNTI